MESTLRKDLSRSPAAEIRTYFSSVPRQGGRKEKMAVTKVMWGIWLPADDVSVLMVTMSWSLPAARVSLVPSAPSQSWGAVGASPGAARALPNVSHHSGVMFLLLLLGLWGGLILCISSGWRHQARVEKQAFFVPSVTCFVPKRRSFCTAVLRHAGDYKQSINLWWASVTAVWDDLKRRACTCSD